jgi:RimJ/RimL family protein N-acetyltransferase
MTPSPLLPRPPIDVPSIPGRTVELRRFALERDGPGLWRAIGADPALWAGIPSGPFASETDFLAWLGTRAERPNEALYTIFTASGLAASGVAAAAAREAAGLFFLLHIEPAMGTAEIGLVYGPCLSRRRTGTEAFFALARHIFETLGYRRLEWRCSMAHAQSLRAAARFGFTAEGVLRQSRWIKGANYDTAVLSIIDREWPDLARRFAAWLAPENFAPDGRQIRRLGDLA